MPPGYRWRRSPSDSGRAIGTLQATEGLKVLLGRSLSGRLLLYDALGVEVWTLKVKRDPACALCGENPTITSLTAAE